MSVRALACLLLLTASSFGQTSFSKQTYATGNDPVDLIVGDVNHDGIPDLISVDKSDNAVSVRLGNGDGTFKARTTYAVGNSPVGGSTADFQKDGRADIVTVNQGANNVSILIGNGDGTFQTHRDLAVGAGPDSVVAGDFNGDGKTDIVTADYDSNTISILPGNGDGTFGTRIVLPAGTQHPYKLVKGDFNGDGKLDLLFADCCQGTDVAFDTLHVLLNQGNFQFTDVTAFNVSVTQALHVGRINGDAKDDLAVSYQGCHTPCEGVSLYTSNGDGTFTPKAGLAVSELLWNSPTNVVFGDFDGDGRLDVAVAASCCGEGVSNNAQDAVLLYIQQPDGSYPDGVLTLLGTGVGPSVLATGDLNRDKKADLVVATHTNHSLTVLKNTTAFPIVCSAPSTSGVHICSPTAGATVSSPIHIIATAKGTTTMARTEVWIDYVKKYQAAGSKVDVSLPISTGTHRIAVQGIQTDGGIVKAAVNVTVK